MARQFVASKLDHKPRLLKAVRYLNRDISGSATAALGDASLRVAGGSPFGRLRGDRAVKITAFSRRGL